MTMRIFSLDLIRCLAIVLLLVGHIALVLQNPIGKLFNIGGFYAVSPGGLAVTIFPVLSGLTIELQYGNRRMNFGRFMFRRIIRIYPVYYMCLLFSIIVFFVSKKCVLSAFINLGPEDIILSITGGYVFVGRWGGPFLRTSWFIGLIMVMYLLYPFLSKIIKKHPTRSIIILFIVSLLSRYLISRHGILPYRALEWFPLCRIFEFSLGIYLAHMIPGIPGVSPAPQGIFISIITLLGKLSFPLFLVHHPLLFMIRTMMSNGINTAASITVYLFVSILVSYIIYSIDNMIPKKNIFRMLGTAPLDP